VRVLFACSVGGAGHFNPLRPFIEAATRRGDEILVVTPPDLERMVLEAGYPLHVGAAPPDEEVAAIREGIVTAPPAEAAVLGDRELFGRLCTAAMLPAMEQVFLEWRPDLVLREPCEYSSAVVAERSGLPHALVAISQAEVEASVLTLVAPVLAAYGAEITEHIRSSPYLTRMPASLDPSPFPLTHRFRESQSLGVDPLPDWWNGKDAPLVYVTFGSVTGATSLAAKVYRTALDAVAELEARVLLTVGRSTDRSLLGAVPANVHVEEWVPQAEALAGAAVVVCHGGSGTTFGALAAGVPLVVVPLFADQTANGRLVAAAGAGLTVELPSGWSGERGPLAAPEARRIGAAIEAVLGEGSYRLASAAIADEMSAAPQAGQLLSVLAAR
jgi:UDP:flavonoid glycosyltransferase YjiC (YdhE family)